MRQGRHTVGPKHEGPAPRCDQALVSGPRVPGQQPTATGRQRPQEPTARMLRGPRRNFGRVRAAEDTSRLARGPGECDFERKSVSRAANFERLAPLTNQPGSRVDLAPFPQEFIVRDSAVRSHFGFSGARNFRGKLEKCRFGQIHNPLLDPWIGSVDRLQQIDRLTE